MMRCRVPVSHLNYEEGSECACPLARPGSPWRQAVWEPEQTGHCSGSVESEKRSCRESLAYIFTRGVAEPPGQDELLQVSVSHLGRRCLPRPLEKASLFSDWLRRLPVGLETPGFGSQCCHLPVVCSWTSYLIPQAQGFLICKLGMLILSL